MTVRVSAGWLKGTVLQTPPGMATRPTTSRVREAVMDMIRDRIEGAALLELFAGSGAFSIEALSRGAHKAVLVENDRKALAALRQNLALAGQRAAKQQIPVPEMVLLGIDAAKGWKQIGCHAPFQLVWVDPPYDELVRWLPPLMEQLPRLIATDGILLVESDAKGERSILEMLAQQSGAVKWQTLKKKRYGDTHITMLTLESSTKAEALSADVEKE